MIEGVVLIAWEHRMIPSIATLLAGPDSKVPQIWPDDRYDLVWVFEKMGQGDGIAFREVPQMLLAGDQPGPVGTAGPA